MILRDASLFRTLKHLPRGLLGAALATLDAIEADCPNLPAPQDETLLIPPAIRRWRRRIAASSWWVVYTFDPTSETLILRTVNDLG